MPTLQTLLTLCISDVWSVVLYSYPPIHIHKSHLAVVTVILWVDDASDGPLCAPLTTSNDLCVFKNGSVCSATTYSSPWPEAAVRSWKHTENFSCFFTKQSIEKSTSSLYFIRGVWRWRTPEGRREKAKQRDVTAQCEMGFKLMWSGLWTNGLKAPWQGLVCFRVVDTAFVQCKSNFTVLVSAC